MTQEKILAFLNMEKDKPIDRGFMCLVFWLDFGVSIFIVLGGLLTRVLDKSFFSVVFILSLIISIAVFAIWLKLAKNPAQLHLYNAIVTTSTFTKSVFGSKLFSTLNNESFNILYIIVTIFFVYLALSIVLKKQRILKQLKSDSVEQVKKELKKKNKGVGTIVMPISVTAAIGFSLSQMTSRTFSMGLGFILWALASIWLFMAIGFMYNYIIARKYKVADIFSQKQSSNQVTQSGDGSLIDNNQGTVSVKTGKKGRKK